MSSNKKDISKVLLVARSKYSHIVLDAVGYVLDNPSIIKKVNIDEWGKISKNDINIGVEATYDENKKESLLEVRFIKTTNKRNIEYTKVKEICCVVKGRNITVLDRVDYINRIESLFQVRGQFFEVPYDKEALLQGIKVSNMKKLKSYVNDYKNKDTGIAVVQNIKYPVRGMKTHEVPVHVNMAVYAEDKNKSVVIDAINRLFYEKTMLSKHVNMIDADKILVKNIPGIPSIKKVEATYDKNRDRCYIKVIDNDNGHKEKCYIVDKQNIVHISNESYDKELNEISSEKVLKCTKYVAKHSINTLRDDGRLRIGIVRNNKMKKYSNKKSKVMMLYNNINKLKVKFLQNKIYKILNSINIFKYINDNKMKKGDMVYRGNEALQKNVDSDSKQLSVTEEEKKLLYKSADAVKERRPKGLDF